MADSHVGDARRYRQPNSLTEAERVDLVRRYSAGDPLVEIAAAFGLSEGSTSKIAHDAGCERRTKRGPKAAPLGFEPGALAVVEWEGEPRVVDTVLGKALGYGRPERIRDLIQGRADLFRGAGNLPRRAVNSDDPGRGRPSREFLLNREQVNLAILLCGLPNVDHIKAHVAKVFTAWEEGRLQATSLETAVTLEDSREAAAASAPDLEALKAAIEPVRDDISDMAARMEAQIDQLLTFVLALKKTQEAANQKKRRDPSPETKRTHIQTVERFYGGKCPCCRLTNVVEAGRLTAHGCFDHKTGNYNKNGLHETWLVCSTCNADFERPKYPQERRDAQFVAYQMFVPKTAQSDLPL